jgi:hypothetical protein
MSPTVELVRGGNGKAKALVAGDYRREVLRDRKGRITAIEGPTPADHLAQQLLSTERLLTQRIAEAADQQARALEQTALRLEGWQPVAGLLINTNNVKRAAQWLKISWPLTVDWMTDADEAAWRDDAVRDGHPEGAYLNGYRAASITAEHTIVLRLGAGAANTSRTLAHELVHCKQVEALQDKFDEVYRSPSGRELLEGYASLLATTITANLELLRNPQVSP